MRPAKNSPPNLMQICATIQALLLFPTLGGLPRDFKWSAVVALVLNGACIYGVVKMRRWGAVGFGALFALAVAHAHARYGDGHAALGVIFGLSLRGSILLPCVMYWDRMTWRATPSEPAERGVK